MESNLNLNDLSIRVLILEDSYHDAELVKYELSKAGYQLTITHTIDKASFSEALQKEQFDIILSDFNLPAFDAFRALELCQEICPKIPFICVSGSIGEEVAIDLLKKGAVDYVMKDRLARLPFSIQRALEEVVEKEARYKADYELKISEEKFRNIFQNHAAVKLIIDPDNGNIIEANNSAAEFYGWPVETLKNMNIKQFNSTPFADLKKGFKLAKTGKKTSFEWVHNKADGSKVDVEVFSSGIQIGHKYFLHSVIHDISDRKKAEEKIKLLNRAIESSSVSVFITDANGFIIYVNPFFTELTGYTFEEVKGKNPRLLKSGYNSKEFYEDFWNTIQSGKDWFGEFRNRKKNGDLYWEKAVISPILNTSGTITNYVAIKEDITERKAMLDELVIARNKAEESDRLKSAFLANMSHEIRTPLNSIIGFSTIMSESSEDNEENKKMRKYIKYNSEILIHIIEDIIDFSTIEAGLIKLSYQPVNLNHLLTDIYEIQKKRINDSDTAHLELRYHKYEEEIVLNTDKFRLIQILNNLISNAIKYTEKGKIEFGYSLKTDNEPVELQFYVRDTGIGIAESEIAHIFNRFYKVQGKLDTVRGVGLGLAIVKQLVEKMKGKIWLETEIGKGSVFYFSFPYQKVNISDSVPKYKYNLPDLKGMLALVAEDDNGNFFLTKLLLKRMGVKVLRAENGLKAVEICNKQNDIDFVLMDLKMPIMDGLEATMKIRESNKNLLIFAVSAHVMKEAKISALNAGCNDYILKPISKKALIEKLGIHKNNNNKLPL